MRTYVIKKIIPYAYRFSAYDVWNNDTIKDLPKLPANERINILDKEYIIRGKTYKHALQGFFYHGIWEGNPNNPVWTSKIPLGFTLPIKWNLVYAIVTRDLSGKVNVCMFSVPIRSSLWSFSYYYEANDCIVDTDRTESETDIAARYANENRSYMSSSYDPIILEQQGSDAVRDLIRVGEHRVQDFTREMASLQTNVEARRNRILERTQRRLISDIPIMPPKNVKLKSKLARRLHQICNGQSPKEE